MADPTNKSYDGIISWAKASDNDIKAKQLATARNITITNNGGTSVVATAGSFDGTGTATIKLKDPVAINVTGNVTGNCSGSSGSCTGNSASSTYATNIRISQDVGAKWRPLLLATDHTTGANQAPLVSGNQKSTSPAVADISLRAYTDANATATGQEKRAILCIGNNISNADTTNDNYKYSKYGQVYMYGTGKGYTIIKPGYNADSSVTLTLPSGTGTLARTSDNITGNAATATTAQYSYAVNLNRATGTSGYAIPIAHTTALDGSTMHALYTAANTQNIVYSGLGCIPGANVNANTEGTTTLLVGNSLAKSSAENRTGNIRIYGNNTGYTTIKPGYNSTSNIELTLPSSEGTLALTGENITSYYEWEISYLKVIEIEIHNSFKIKYVLPTHKSQSTVVTLTWKKPFTSYCVRRTNEYDGSNHIYAVATTIDDHKGGYFYGDSSVAHGWSVTRPTLTSVSSANKWIYNIIVFGI